MKLTGAQLTIRLLESEGIRIISGIPGGANLPLYDALAESTQIRHVLARHEQGAGFIAQGMARISGRPEVCFATSGPGATNILTAIADAKLDSIPLVCITGQVPASMIGTDAFQEVDTYGMSIPITKHNFLARSAAELLEMVPQAFQLAASGRPGPVLIDIPKDVQKELIEVDALPQPLPLDATPMADQNALQCAAALINTAQRPLFCIGGGVVHANASSATQALVEKAALPATMTLMGLGALPADHSLALGMLGMHAQRFVNMALEECDLFIAAGMRFDDRATGRLAQFCPNAKIVHIDIDPSEMNKLKSAEVALVGDVKEVLEALLPLLEMQSHTAWLERIEQLRTACPVVTGDRNSLSTPEGLIHQAAQLLGADTPVTTDVGQHQMWTAQHYPFQRPRRWLTSGGLGTMGFGLPAAIGAALARPDSPVLCISGDGSLMMNIQELATAVEERLNIKIVLMNNNALGLVRQQQELFYGARYIASQFPLAPDFTMIAQGFGMSAVDLGAASDPKEAFAEALLNPGPCLIHAPIGANENVFPMVPPGAANAEMIGGECNTCACV